LVRTDPNRVAATNPFFPMSEGAVPLPGLLPLVVPGCCGLAVCRCTATVHLHCLYCAEMFTLSGVAGAELVSVASLVHPPIEPTATPTEELWCATVAAVSLKPKSDLLALLHDTMPLLYATLCHDVSLDLKRYAYTFVRLMYGFTWQ